MTEQEYLSAIANLADKVSRYHERLLAAERDLRTRWVLEWVGVKHKIKWYTN